MEEYMDELEETEKAAMNRLNNNWWDADDEYSKNEVSLEPEEVPDEIGEFKDKKKSIDPLEDAVNKTRQVYNKSGDRGRNISIASKMNNRSSNLDEYMDNIQKVEKTLEFEDNLNIDQEGDVFEEDRTRTTGDITWVNDQGQEVRTLVFSTGVEFQVGGVGSEAQYKREFDSKKEAKRYYKENRLA